MRFDEPAGESCRVTFEATLWAADMALLGSGSDTRSNEMQLLLGD